MNKEERMKIDTSVPRKILSENMGEFIAKHINEFADTAHWIYSDGKDIVAFEDADMNVLYVFNTTAYLSKFMNDNAWTYDGIVDFESRSQVLYNYDADGEFKSADYLVSELTQDDADKLAEHLEWILGGEK